MPGHHHDASPERSLRAGATSPRATAVALWVLATVSCGALSASAGGLSTGLLHAVVFGVLVAGAGLLAQRRADRLSRAAAREHGLHSALIARMQEAVITLDAEGRIRTWSPGAERIYGWGAQEVIGKLPADVSPLVGSRDHVIRALDVARTTGECCYEARRRRRDGAEIAVSVSMVSLEDAHGAPDGALAVVRDVTAQKLAEGALRDSAGRLSVALAAVRREVSRREKLLSVVAHDLRSPLSAIAFSAGQLEQFAEGAANRQALAERGTTIREATQRASRLIEDLVDVTAIQVGGLRLDCEPRDPLALCEEAARQSRQAASRKELELVLTVPPDPLPWVRCDGGRILQALGNLITNAVQVSPPNGKVVVGLEDHDRELLFSVRDGGPGIDEQIAEHLFEPYQRGNVPHKGAGLGLAIARGIVEGHGGRIWAERPEGGGARLCFTIPRGPEDRSCAA